MFGNLYISHMVKQQRYTDIDIVFSQAGTKTCNLVTQNKQVHKSVAVFKAYASLEMPEIAKKKMMIIVTLVIL